MRIRWWLALSVLTAAIGWPLASFGHGDSFWHEFGHELVGASWALLAVWLYSRERKLEAALRFYADPEAWKPEFYMEATDRGIVYDARFPAAVGDQGEEARSALGVSQ